MLQENKVHISFYTQRSNQPEKSTSSTPLSPSRTPRLVCVTRNAVGGSAAHSIGQLVEKTNTIHTRQKQKLCYELELI